MYRSISTRAIVIRRERLGEFHKSLLLLTSDLGLIWATAYGAYKMHSALRLGSEPFTASRALLYHNPVKNTYKVMELEIIESFPGLQADLARITAASLWAEVVQKSYGAGETTDTLFRLLVEGLRLLQESDPRLEPYLTIQFLWRFLTLAGYLPDLGRCERCSLPLDPSARAFYSASDNAVVCAACGGERGSLLPAGALRYLEASRHGSIRDASQVRLEAASLGALRDVLPRMVQGIFEGQLKSLPSLGIRA
ncbi:MAG TPA: DNA repair protein RecO [Spirochaetia bacterium]|nr:DNA repair protein RecO [Spirochaetia bacterium]